MPLLTSYRPNFCAECGSKIVRLRWLPWNSRRFCNSCVPRFRRQRLIQPAVLVAAIFIAGLIAGRSGRPKPPPLIIERVSNANAGVDHAESLSATTAQTNSVAEQVFICGARTKKGTPCSRRVHGPMRCWQHKGMPAMLPQDKLVVKD